ncbi:MAG: response regulator [Anaerolineae bacterium]|nr:response regulator [Anaerolineae bacterium]
MPTVLVVDDHEVVRRVIQHVLQPLSLDVIEAADPQTALELAQTYRMDLLLLDTNLPGMDGIALMKRLKALPHLATVPMIILSSRGGADDEIRALEAGAAGFLSKPFRTQELRDTVLRAIASV